jgi:ABC-type amino acid transport system permease subunit
MKCFLKLRHIFIPQATARFKMTELLAVIGSLFAIILGICKHYGRKSEFRRKQADQSGKDLENAQKNDSPSDFLDGFGRMR